MATDIKELAISYWRMEKWVSNVNVERKVAANSALRTIKKYLDENKIEILDLVGQQFDSRLAVDIINNEVPDGTEENNIIISEMIKPIIMQDGAVIQFGQVSIGTEIKKQKENHTIDTKSQNDTMENDVSQTKEMLDEITKLSEYVKTKHKVIPHVLAGVLIIVMIANISLVLLTRKDVNDKLNGLPNSNSVVITESEVESINQTEAKSADEIKFKKYEVKPGDSLLKICDENRISYSENLEYIKAINGIENINQIYAGQQLLIPISD